MPQPHIPCGMARARARAVQRHVRRARRGATALVAMAVVLAALLPGAAAPPSPAPDFTLDLLSGGTLTRDSIRGSPAILLFWAPW